MGYTRVSTVAQTLEQQDTALAAAGVFTTITDPAAARPADLVNRHFKASMPNRLWVADITFVRAWQGFCYTAFVTDAAIKKIVGWAVSATMRAEDLPLQAFNHAVWQSNSTLSELVHHSDRGSQYLSLAYTDRSPNSGSHPRSARAAIVMTTPSPKSSTPPTRPN